MQLNGQSGRSAVKFVPSRPAEGCGARRLEDVPLKPPSPRTPCKANLRGRHKKAASRDHDRRRCRRQKQRPPSATTFRDRVRCAIRPMAAAAAPIIVGKGVGRDKNSRSNQHGAAQGLIAKRQNAKYCQRQNGQGATACSNRALSAAMPSTGHSQRARLSSTQKGRWFAHHRALVGKNFLKISQPSVNSERNN